MPASLRPRRSALYVPGSNARAIAKAKTVPADVLIFDLEDSVATGQKDSAREAVATAVAELTAATRSSSALTLSTRLGSLATSPPWSRSSQTRCSFPRSSAPTTSVARAALAAANAPKTLDLWVMIETPAAILNAAAIAAIAAIPPPSITGFVIGTNDLLAEIGAPPQPGRAALIPHLSQALLAARAHGLVILDGTFNDLDDKRALRAECLQGRDMGMDGKTVIHPIQVPIANEAFSPDVEELAWARRVVDAFAQPDNSGVEVMRLAGRMVERLHERATCRMLALANAIEAMDKETKEKGKTRATSI